MGINEMKKVGILTLNGNWNYGNRLQNYALERVIENLGYIPVTLWFNEYSCLLERYLFYKKLVHSVNRRRFRKFKNFTKHHLNVNRVRRCENSLADYFVVGSDQVWNFDYATVDFQYLLDFSDYSKNIAYAASIGTSELSKKYSEEAYRHGFDNLKYISVREDRAKEIVENVTGRDDVEVVLDPTMLLSSREWDEIAKKPNDMSSEKYILCYFLGGMGDREGVIRKFASEQGFIVIDMMNERDSLYASGPEEFLYLEKHAELVCTDSFHSAVFAILYNRPLVVFDRNGRGGDGGSRLDTLLSKFGLLDRKFLTGLTKDILQCDYTEANRILSAERKKSKDFLRKALKG